MEIFEARHLPKQSMISTVDPQIELFTQPEHKVSVVVLGLFGPVALGVVAPVALRPFAPFALRLVVLVALDC